MIGNTSSIQAAALVTLALHASIAVGENIIEREASGTVDSSQHWTRKGRKRHRRTRLHARHDANGSEELPHNDWHPPNGGTRRLKDCLGWHAEMKNQDGCSNDNNYPDNWLDSRIKDKMFHATSQACCDFFYNGKTCNIYETGCEEPAPTPPQAYSSKCKWHPDMETQKGCTNDDNYPEEWLRPEAASHMFKPTPEECCDTFFPGGQHCEVYNRGCKEASVEPNEPVPPPPVPPRTSPPVPLPVSPPPPQGPAKPNNARAKCVAPGWHPDIKKSNSCSNSDEYPDQWLDSRMKANMFNPSSQQCCDRFFKDKDCELVDEKCSMDFSITVETRPRPTFRPTPDGPTPQPTPVPTTPVPTVTPLGYYVDHFSGLCVDQDENTPHYITQFYREIQTCCHFSFAKAKCLSTIPQSGNEGVYYVPHAMTICVDSNEVEMPYYITETFNDYGECCRKASSNIIECLDAAPSGYDVTNLPELPDRMIEIKSFGSVSIELPTIPEQDTRGWDILKSLLTNAITSVMSESPIVNEGLLVVDLSRYGWHSFQNPERRLNKIDADKNNKEAGQMERRQANQQTLEFEVTIHARCDTECQSTSTSLHEMGQYIFYELDSHWDEYVDTGVFSSLLKNMARSSDLFSEADDPPVASNGILTFRTAGESSATLVPTWSPTEFQPSDRPTYKPTSPYPTPSGSLQMTKYTSNSSGKEECESAAFHPLEDFSEPKCTNSLFYPNLWNTQGARAYFLFDTAEDCCNFFAYDSSCIVEDVCKQDNNGPASGGTVAFKPANVKTKQPTPKPTRRTRRPTKKPSKSPIVEHAWYIDPSSNICVQDCSQKIGPPCGGKKSEWAESFTSAEDCCARVSWKSFEDCAYVPHPTISPSSEPTEPKPLPAPKPSWHPTQVPSLSPITYEPTIIPTTLCSTLRWYYDKAEDQCTNDLMPPLWNIEPEIGQKFLFDSVQGCCLVHSPGICSVKDVCGENLPSYCGGLWHPTTPERRTCSNSWRYPRAWLNDDRYMHKTKEECCKSFYGDALCLIEDACYD